jgi:hypothetical protein
VSGGGKHRRWVPDGTHQSTRLSVAAIYVLLSCLERGFCS